MSRLIETNITEVLTERLDPWLNNPPNFYEMRDTYSAYGTARANLIRRHREKERIEDQIAIEFDKPRSTAAQKAKRSSTEVLKDEIAELEAEIATLEAEIKALEFMKTMFSAANYRIKLQKDL